MTTCREGGTGGRRQLANGIDHVDGNRAIEPLADRQESTVGRYCDTVQSSRKYVRGFRYRLQRAIDTNLEDIYGALSASRKGIVLEKALKQEFTVGGCRQAGLSCHLRRACEAKSRN